MLYKHIDYRRYLSIISACTLGWACGFIIYATVLSSSVAELRQSTVTMSQPAFTVHAVPYPQSQYDLNYAVFRQVSPQFLSPAAKTVPRDTQEPAELLPTSRSYFL